MQIKKWIEPGAQMCSVGTAWWSVARLFELSRDRPIMDIPLDHLCVYYEYKEGMTLREMVMHMQAVNNADLDKPIILDENGMLMDGRHRIMKAMLTGAVTIKAVRFDVNPDPCHYDHDFE